MNGKKIGLVSFGIALLFSVMLIPLALAAPTISTGDPSDITGNSVCLSASFANDGNTVTVWFEIDGSKTPQKSYSSSTTHTQVVTGLDEGTTYTYRAVLKYSTGSWFWKRYYTIYGEEKTFTTDGSTPPPPPPPPSTDKDPILFVHGWRSKASVWNTMMNRLKSEGYSDNMLYAYTFASPSSSGNGINAKNAEQIQIWVNQILMNTGASKVDLVSHSMGGLSTRYYVKFLDGINKVDDYVSLGSPHHGASLASWIGGDMKIGSALLTQLNSGDETPGNIDWTTVRSTADSAVRPTDSAMLDGALNHLVSGVGHNDLHQDLGVYSLVCEAIA